MSDDAEAELSRVTNVAKSPKGKTKKSKIDDAAPQAVEVSMGDASEVANDAADDAVVSNDMAEPVDAAEPEEARSSEDADSADGSDVATDRTEDPEPTTPMPAQAEARPQSLFVPLVLGGIVAGAIGYGIATYYPLSTGSDELSAQLEAQANRIASLEAELAAIPAPDLSEVNAQVAEVQSQATARLDEVTASLEGQFAAIDARITEVEKRPGADGTLSDTALAAYQRELEDLRADLDAQKEDVMTAAAQAEADLTAAREEAAALEQQALAAAEAAAARAALNRVAAAVETGAPFESALADIGTADLPVALTNAAQTGVATTAELVGDFPAAARAALATARAEGVSDDAGGLGGFLRSQFDVRSTAPQEGSGPDAILSRAEAAIKEGRVADALAEIEALPEVARAEMTVWTAQATERADVLDAIATLFETFN